ncbi:hypothetical protein D6777_01515, partial [Candidatus Woesearchaeota archaeon]
MKKTFFFNILILSILLSTTVSSFAGVSPAKIKINFEPNKEFKKTLTVFGYDNPTLNTTCNDIVKVENITKVDEGHKITIKIKFKDKFGQPGKNYCGLTFTEKDIKLAQSTFGTKALVSSRLDISVPYPGYYAKLTLTAPNINKDQTQLFHIKVENLGENVLPNIKVDVKIYDIKNNFVDIVSTDTVTIPKFEFRETDLAWQSKGKESGKYKAVATLYYGGDEPATDEKNFIIGKIYVEFLKATVNMTPHKINPFNIDVASWWGNDLKNVYAEVKIKNSSGVDAGEFKTLSVDLAPWQTKTLTGYWDATNWGEGKYNAQIRIKYEDNETVVNDWEVNLVQPKINKKKPFYLSPIFILIVVIFLILLVDLI